MNLKTAKAMKRARTALKAFCAARQATHAELAGMVKVLKVELKSARAYANVLDFLLDDEGRCLAFDQLMHYMSEHQQIEEHVSLLTQVLEKLNSLAKVPAEPFKPVTDEKD